jgi:hypothetical protein
VSAPSAESGPPSGGAPDDGLTYDPPLATLNLKDYQDFQVHYGLRGTRLD